MPVFNVIQMTFPDGSHRWKYFTYGQQVGQKLESFPSTEITPQKDPGWSIKRKEYENASRAKQTIYNLARANSCLWEWFVTLTFHPNIVQRNDYHSCYSAVRDLGKLLTSLGCLWLFVPEHHKDGRSYHFHGLVGGSRFMEVLEYAGEFGPRGSKRPTYHIVPFPGFTSVQPIIDVSRVCTYITKYITKDLVHLVPKGCHRYLRSRNLLEPQLDYLSLQPGEFATMINWGEYHTDSQFEEGLSKARFVKEIPIRYTLNTERMYIVED